jgi:hypothetical protein
MPIRSARPRQEVLRLVPVGASRGWCETDHAPGQESESERGCRALGSIRETRVPVKAGSVWRRSVATQSDRIHGSLSSGTQSPGQEQQATDATGCVEGPEDPLPPTARALIEVLCPRRMNILALRGPLRCTQFQTVVWSTSKPRSFKSSSTSRSDREYRRYQRTALRIRTGSVCRHLKIAGRVAISGSLQATSPATPGSCNTSRRSASSYESEGSKSKSATPELSRLWIIRWGQTRNVKPHPGYHVRSTAARRAAS